jgi:hypothetical protein
MVRADPMLLRSKLTSLTRLLIGAGQSAWTTRFGITGADGQLATPEHATQPTGKFETAILLPLSQSLIIFYNLQVKRSLGVLVP